MAAADPRAHAQFADLVRIVAAERRIEAFVLSDPKTRALYARAFAESAALFYGEKPAFEQVLGRIGEWTDRL